LAVLSLMSYVNIASSGVLLLFGLAVLAFSKRRPRDVAFALYASGFAIGTLLSNLRELFPSRAPLWYDLIRTICYGVGGVAGFLVAWHLHPTGLERSRSRMAATFALAAVVTVCVTLLNELFAGFISIQLQLPGGSFGLALLLAGPLAGSFLLALDYRAARGSSDQARRGLAVVAGALSLYPILYLSSWWSIAQNLPAKAADAVLRTALLIPLQAAIIAVVVAWALAARTSHAHKGARNVALLALLVALVGLAAGTAGCDGHVSFCGLPALTRFVGVSIVAYSILRHDLLGLDLKVRWGVKRGTSAGLFLGVVFVVGAIAQNYFGESYGPVLGGLTAGLLLFAISPIQRMAERVAHAAVPLTNGGEGESAPAAAARPSQGDELYREALRIALVDRSVNPSEELHLFRLAERLGIGAGRAMELRQEVESSRARRKAIRR
jgi:hypothetical protein